MRRRNQEEAMDQADLDPDLLADDLRNLEALNRLFGGRRVVRRRLGELLAELAPGEPLQVLDIGSGAGDLCGAALNEGRRRAHPVRLISLDRHPQIQAYARRQLAAEDGAVRFLRADAARLPLSERSVDLALCTLALHHFTEDAAVMVLREMRRVTRRWAVVSDLVRSPQAYAGVWFATRFTRNPMTRHDGPVSVRRAFSSAELRALAERAGWESFRTHAEPWFRVSLVYRRPA